MSFRHDMKNKTPQQREIVRQRDEYDKKLREDSIFPKPDFQNNDIIAYKGIRKGDYESVSFWDKDKDKDKLLLELRVSGTAIVNAPCGLRDVDIHKWIWFTGLEFVNELDKSNILTILSYDVVDKKLITPWENLKRVNE